MLQKQHLYALMAASHCSHLPTPTTKIVHFLFFYAFTWRIFPQISLYKGAKCKRKMPSEKNLFAKENLGNE